MRTSKGIKRRNGESSINVSPPEAWSAAEAYARYDQYCELSAQLTFPPVLKTLTFYELSNINYDGLSARLLSRGMASTD